MGLDTIVKNGLIVGYCLSFRSFSAKSISE